MSTAAEPALPASNLNAILFMVLAGGVNVCMLSMIKYLTADLHAFQIAFFRCLFGFIALTPVILRNGGFAVMKTRRIGLHALRGGLNAVAMLLYFWALTYSPLDLVSAISFSAPLFAALLAILILREKVGLRRWAGLAVGFLGALVILRPGSDALDFGALLALGSSLGWAMAIITIKQLTRTESPLAVTAWAALFVGLFALGPALYVWRWPDPWQWGLILVIGALGSIVQFSFAKAFSLAETTVVLPFDFLKLVWAAIIGYLLFSDVPVIWTWLGGSVIFASTIYVAYRERLAQKRPASPDDRSPDHPIVQASTSTGSGV